MTSSTLPKTVLLRGDPFGSEGTVATAAITPGMAVTAAGDTVTRAGAGAVPAGFARENELLGKGIDDDYAIGHNILYWTPRPGDWMYAILAASQVIVAGDALSCGANGALVKATPASQSTDSPFAFTPATPVVARALEAVTTTGEVARIKVEVV